MSHEELIDEQNTGRPEAIDVDSIWLTKPSVKPVLLAFFLMLSLVGLFGFRPLLYISALAVLIITVSWISESRDESDELPLG
ncbi:MAG: hypothetical protein QM648_09120 [Solirubrobacterales bacterium]